MKNKQIYKNYFIWIIFRVGEDGPWDQVSHIFTSTNSTLYQVTGLLPFTVYSFRAIAVNSLGLSLPSKESYYIVTLREGKHYFWHPFSFNYSSAFINNSFFVVGIIYPKFKCYK